MSVKAALLKNAKQLEIVELEKPAAQKGEAVLKVRYAGVCGSDITVYRGEHPTATLPVVPGHEILGTIEEIDDDSKKFSVGDRVVVDPLISCGVCEACLSGHQHVCQSLKLLGIHENGGFEEFVKVSVSKLVKVPDDLSDKAAALNEPFAVGYHVTQRSGLTLGDTALVIGGGPIGLVIALVAREYGARVVVSEPNKRRLALVREFGFETIDPLEEDVPARIGELTGGVGFDVVIEASSSRAGMLLMPNACKIRGTMVPMSLSGKAVEFELGKVSFKELSVVGSRVYEHMHFVRAVDTLYRLSKKIEVERVATQEYGIGQTQRGFDDMIAGTNTGKILIHF